jgi:hypothetical protein
VTLLLPVVAVTFVVVVVIVVVALAITVGMPMLGDSFIRRLEEVKMRHDRKNLFFTFVPNKSRKSKENTKKKRRVN